jgi:hypothetical protein
MRLTLRLSGLAILFAALLLSAGCSGKGDDHKDHKDDDHDDHGPGPHGGVVVEWGSKHEYHPEVTVDRKTKKATVYVLGKDAKKARPIAAESITLILTSVTPPLQIALKADRQEGDPEGSASRFSGNHDKLGEEGRLKGEVRGEFGGTQYTGTFEVKDAPRKDK